MTKGIAKEFEGQLWVTAEYHLQALEKAREAVKAVAREQVMLEVKERKPTDKKITCHRCGADRLEQACRRPYECQLVPQAEGKS